MKFYDRFYDGKHIVKYEIRNGVTVETYVEFENGLVYLRIYIDSELNNSIVIADLTGGQIQ